jgi:hypothetical protein
MERAITPAVSTIEEAPASSQIRSEVLELGLSGSRRFTICLFYQFDTDELNCCVEKHEEILPKIELYLEFFPLLS